MTPAPGPRHQRVSAALYRTLHASCPRELEVLYAPLDVVLADDTVVEPDLVVARRSDFSPRELPAAPLLAIEILSPSTRGVDLTLKRSRFEEAGCPSYWVVDPDEPSLTAWQLQGGKYVEVAHAVAAVQVHLDAPYPVSFGPVDLID